jgi:hypothetical protein
VQHKTCHDHNYHGQQCSWNDNRDQCSFLARDMDTFLETN